MKTVVGLFDHFEDAQQAIQELHDAGFSNEDINLIANDKSGQYSQYLNDNPQAKGQNIADGAAKGAGTGAVLGGLGGLLIGLGALAIPGIGPVIAAGPIATTLAGAGVGAVAGGIVGALVDLGIPEENAKTYAEGVRHGGTLVAVRSNDTMAQQAADILNRHNPVDVERRSQDWQMGQENYAQTNMQSSAIPVTGSRTDSDFDDSDNMDLVHDRAVNDQGDLTDDNIPVTGRDADTTIPVIEEDIRVGKRHVEQGGVRVERTEEEVPFEQDVNLHEEHVNVERRPVDREATDADFNAFQEGTMELKETAEEPVVEKRARVVEEVDINKDVMDRTEKIQDTLHRQDVNVTPLNQTNMGSRDWNYYDQSFRSDYQTRFGSGGQGYSYYMPAYRYGYDLAMDPQYRGYDWNRMEPIARRDWEQRGGQGAWQDVKDAVRHAWESVTH